MLQPISTSPLSISTTRMMVNCFVISGYIVRNGYRELEDGSVFFTVAYKGCGRAGILYTPCVMFSSIYGQRISIPRELLRKGSEVIVRGFRKPHEYLTPSGDVHRDTLYVALEAIANDGKTSFQNG